MLTNHNHSDYSNAKVVYLKYWYESPLVEYCLFIPNIFHPLGSLIPFLFISLVWVTSNISDPGPGSMLVRILLLLASGSDSASDVEIVSFILLEAFTMQLFGCKKILNIDNKICFITYIELMNQLPKETLIRNNMFCQLQADVLHLPATKLDTFGYFPSFIFHRFQEIIHFKIWNHWLQSWHLNKNVSFKYFES